jgi:hypothetical protein
MLKVKPYSEETVNGIEWLLHGNMEYYVQRWEYEGEMTVEGFFEAFRDPERVKELLATPTQRIFYDNWGDNVESWTLYNLTKDRFYWDAEGHCLFDLFKFTYSFIQGTCKGYWDEVEDVAAIFKQFLDINPDNKVDYFSTIWGGAGVYRPASIKPELYNQKYGTYKTRIVDQSEYLPALKESMRRRGIQRTDIPERVTGVNWECNKDLFTLASKWFIDWDDPSFESETGRQDLFIFHNHSQKTFTIMALRESEYMLSALEDKGLLI